MRRMSVLHFCSSIHVIIERSRPHVSIYLCFSELKEKGGYGQKDIVFKNHKHKLLILLPLYVCEILKGF